MKFQPRALLTILAVCLLNIAVADSRPPVSIGELPSILKDDSSDGRPFSVTGTVNFCCLPCAADCMTTLDLDIGTGSPVRFYATSRNFKSDMRLGDTVVARGRIAYNNENRRAPIFSSVEVMTRHAPYRRISGANFFDNATRLKVVSLRGIVRESFRDELKPCWIYLVIYSDGRCINATMFDDGQDFDLTSVLGRNVELAGLVANASSTPRKSASRVLVVADSSYMKILGCSSANAFDAPTLDAIDPSTQPEELLSLGLHSVRGVVLAVWGSNKVLIRSENGMLVDLSVDAQSLPDWGEHVVAVGLPATNFYNLQLEHAHWKTDDAPLLVRTKIPQGIPVARAHGNPISIEGTVRYLSNDGINGRYACVEADGELIPVDVSCTPDALSSLSVGCRIAVTGICIIERRALSPSHLIPTVQGLRIAVHSSDDIRVISRPSWWTPARVWSVAGFLLLVILGITIWNVLLQKVAVRKGRQLAREQISRAEAELRIDERTRLAIELHDTLSQNLMGVAMRLDAVVRAVSPCSELATKKIALLSNSIKYCCEELRQCLWDLRSEALEVTDMNEVIRQTLAPHVSARASIVIRFNVPRHRLTDQTVHALIRIVRELTINAIHHGNATRIRIAGSLENNTLLFSVSDNGCGFDVKTAPGIREGHFGLKGISERINLLGGSVTVSSQPGKGTKVTVHVTAPHNHKSTQT